MEIMLHPDKDAPLRRKYREAFSKANELFVVSAYLTSWDKTLRLNPECTLFRLIVGKDFGITRKAACANALAWVPRHMKASFLVADGLNGFHPKLAVWQDNNGKSHMILGSSNLTDAGFDSNYEANVYCELTNEKYAQMRSWILSIEAQCVLMSESWLEQYRESTLSGRPMSGRKQRGSSSEPVLTLDLPRPPGMMPRIRERRGMLKAYEAQRLRLEELFRRCASGAISSGKFYDELHNLWSFEQNNRLQDFGWERRGKNTDFKLFSKTIVAIFDANSDYRDDVVVQQIDQLAEHGVPSRGAFLSEMLCLRFPDKYPVLNKPVERYLRAVDYKPPRGATEGVRYLHIAKALRESLRRKSHPARNLVELDAVIWLRFGSKFSG